MNRTVALFPEVRQQQVQPFSVKGADKSDSGKESKKRKKKEQTNIRKKTSSNDRNGKSRRVRTS